MKKVDKFWEESDIIEFWESISSIAKESYDNNDPEDILLREMIIDDIDEQSPIRDIVMFVFWKVL